jgi:EAL domain-containing protein (putative c-di-GMP-specific phosphodiesterase class I)
MADTILFLNYHGQRQGINSLTKLNDRHRFFKEIEVRTAGGQRFQTFLISIKNFNVLNQKYGHKNGDELLYQFAFALEKLIKKSSAFHMNGTEFALLVPYTWQKTAQEYCGVLLQFLDDGINFMGDQIQLDYIVAEYVVDDPDVSAEIFYERLEYAAGLAKQQNCRYIRYTSDIGERMEREYYLQNRIKHIDRDHGFQVWYQPVYCLSNGKYCSMEALVRLQEPDGRMISPGEFIPLAEATGAITTVTWFVLEESCRLLATRESLKGVNVSINLPMAQLMEPGFGTRLNSIVDRYGVPHDQICLEFTEREILDTFEQTRAIMQELTASGYRFFLDDFGTGYSNYSCILQLPFHTVKLDASLIRISEARGDRDFLPALTKLLHDLGSQVVAEGVETEEVVTHLTEYGVDRIQGFFFARPMGEKQLLEFYQEHSV